MSTTIGTNVAADGNAELSFVTKLFDILENRYLNSLRTEEARMARAIADHIGIGGGVEFKLVNRKYEENLKSVLKRDKIPYICFYDDLGNAAFAVRDKDRDAFVRAQHEVFAMSTDFYAQIEVMDMCNIAKQGKEKNLTVLSLADSADFHEAQVKLYECGIVCSFDQKQKKIYVNPADICNKSGEDLVGFELQWAIDQSMNDKLFDGGEKDSRMQKFRNAAAEYDFAAIKEASNRIRDGKSFALVSANNSSSIYVTYDKNNGLEVFKKSGTRYDSIQHFDAETLKQMPSDSYGALLSKYGFDIKNKIVIAPEDLDNILKSSSEEAQKWSESHSKLSVKDENGVVMELNKRPVRHDYFTERDEAAWKLKKEILEPALGRVMTEARLRVEAQPGVTKMSLPKKREEIKKEFRALIKEKRMPEIQNFLLSTTDYSSSKFTFSKEEKETWLDSIAEHLTNTAEQGRHELGVSQLSIKDIEKAEIDRLHEEEKQKIQTSDEKDKSAEKEEIDVTEE